MRSYGQYCGLAAGLDVIGDRWTLLIVRELLILGPSRYTDLLRGLPGIPTNLLANRLREMEAAGLVERQEPAPPVATPLVSLTERGRALLPVIEAVAAWGAPALGAVGRDAVFRTHWLVLPLRRHLRDADPSRPPVRIEVQAADGALAIEAGNGTIDVHVGRPDAPDAVIAGAPDAVLATLLGHVTLGQARKRGVRITGDTRALSRIIPSSSPATPSHP
ncbi:MAG TPA: winged helix-turn-helix transcriptional regulator [Gemmatimonadaceae bacterium]|nr:winged helix-turn-helix transcriptional regulator [Gemmatimonadaceae bacterium]